MLTVAASTAADTRAGFSNHGPCVALYAPGVGVTSAWHTAPDAAVYSPGAPFLLASALMLLCLILHVTSKAKA